MKYKSNTLIINHFIILSPGAIAIEFCDVPQRQCVYTLHTQKNTNLNIFFYINIKFDGLLGEIDTVIQNVEFNLTMSGKYSQRVQFFLH